MREETYYGATLIYQADSTDPNMCVVHDCKSGELTIRLKDSDYLKWLEGQTNEI